MNLLYTSNERGVMKQFFAAVFCAMLVSIGVSFHVSAQEPSIVTTVSPATVVDSASYRMGERVVVDDLINGDLFCVGNSVVIDAIVNGDVICAGGTVIIRGDVSSDIRILANTITLDGNVKGNATLIGGSVTIGKNAVVGEDSSITAQQINHAGSIGRDAIMRAQTVNVQGNIGRQLQLYHTNATIGDTAAIGTIRYTSPNGLTLPQSLQNIPVHQMPIDIAYRATDALSSTAIVAALMYIGLFLSLLLTALGVAFLFPRSLEDSIFYANKQPVTTAAAGLIAIVVVPVALMLLMVSVVGIPLALIIGSLFLAVVLLSAPFVAHFIGNLFFSERSHPIRALVGAIILIMLYVIPIINIFVAIAVTIFGTGLIIRVATKRYTTAATIYKKSAVRDTINANGKKQKTTPTKKSNSRT